MTKKGKRQSVPRNKSRDYQTVAENFYKGAEMARAYEYWNAAGLLIIHSSIAYSDAITIKLGGIKSRGENYMEVAELLNDVVALDNTGTKALSHLRRMIDEKNLVSYSGEVYSKKEVEMLWKHLDRFRDWARQVLSE